MAINLGRAGMPKNPDGYQKLPELLSRNINKALTIVSLAKIRHCANAGLVFSTEKITRSSRFNEIVRFTLTLQPDPNPRL
jgi:hypothetical protein